MPLQPHDSIFLAGHQGLVGSTVLDLLRREGFDRLLLRSHQDLDLTRQEEVETLFDDNDIDCAIVAAARVGGIHANNTYRAEFIYENLMIATNVIHAAWRRGVRQLLFLGSSCIYPRNCPQPMREPHLLTGALEPTNEPYAVAKIAGLKMCEAYNRQYGTAYLSLMPTNLYGPRDNFDSENSHVIPAMLRKVHDAKQAGREQVTLWGTGNPRREFLYVEDLARACLQVLRQPLRWDVLNVGSGMEVTIAELARTVCDVVGYSGTLRFDPQMPDGAPRKLLDSSRIRELGWEPQVSLAEGLRRAYAWYLDHLTDEAT